jgi:hypothetical protein
VVVAVNAFGESLAPVVILTPSSGVASVIIAETEGGFGDV